MTPDCCDLSGSPRSIIDPIPTSRTTQYKARTVGIRSSVLLAVHMPQPREGIACADGRGRGHSIWSSMETGTLPTVVERDSSTAMV
jgi:hypothetical protein